jgi:large subunit ribosomal protein L9
MKLILTQEVSGLGGPGDVVEVKDGYGRNYLVPKGLAMRWTHGGEKQIGTIRRAREVREIRDLGQAQDVASALQSLRVTLPRRAGDGGRLFGSVTVVDVVDAVKAAGGPSLDRRRIELPHAIKTVGTHRIAVRLHPEVSADVDVEVVPDTK